MNKKTKMLDKIIEKQFKSAIDFCKDNFNFNGNLSWFTEVVKLNKMKKQWELEKETDREYKYAGKIK